MSSVMFRRVLGTKTAALGLIIPWLFPSLVMAAPLELGPSIELAQKNDPWLQGADYQLLAIQAEQIAFEKLPNPMVSLGVANLPIDTFDFNQEPMTQFKVGVTQPIPRGDTLALRSKQSRMMAEQIPYQTAERAARIKQSVSNLWLESYRLDRVIKLIEGDQALFEQLVDVAQSNYRSGAGRSQQENVIRAQLELVQLQDRLLKLKSQRAVNCAQLLEWLYPQEDSQNESNWSCDMPNELPQFNVVSDKAGELSRANLDQRTHYLQSHPAILSAEQDVQIMGQSIHLAEQELKPQWAVNASYGYRDEDPMGQDRADFFSVGVSVDFPLWGSAKQDNQIKAAKARTQSLTTKRSMVMRSMLSQLTADLEKLSKLDQRRQLYNEQILALTEEQSEATLTSYTNDNGDFAEAVRARISELNARIEKIEIDIERLKTLARIEYFSAGHGITEMKPVKELRL